MSRIVRTRSSSFGPSVVDFDRLPRGTFKLEIEAHGVIVRFNEVAVSKGAYSKDRVVECDLGELESMVDSSGALIATAATLDAIRDHLAEIGILSLDVRDGGYDCYSHHDDAGSKAVALRDFSKRIVDAVRLVLAARKPPQAPTPRHFAVLSGGALISAQSFVPEKGLDFPAAIARRCSFIESYGRVANVAYFDVGTRDVASVLWLDVFEVPTAYVVNLLRYAEALRHDTQALGQTVRDTGTYLGTVRREGGAERSMPALDQYDLDLLRLSEPSLAVRLESLSHQYGDVARVEAFIAA